MKDLANQIVTLLSEFEIISLKFSNEATLYVTILNQAGKYLQFRISTHQSYSSFYSNKSFKYYGKYFERLSENILSYLENAPWQSFGYYDYFALSVVKKADRRRVSFYLDNSFGIFSENKMHMVFYQQNHYVKDTYFNLLEEDFDQQLRKLFATGLLASYTHDETILEIYLTDGGFKLLARFDDLYGAQFLKDYNYINWRKISLPKLYLND